MNIPEASRILPQLRTIALIAAGSNARLGSKPLPSTLDSALQEIGRKAGVIRSVSRYFSTPAFPPGSGPDFVNAAFEWASDLPPREVLRTLHDVESAFGRVRKERWGQRTLDLDLLAIGQTVLPDADTTRHWIDLPLDAQQACAPDTLVLPHPRMQDRAFVLVPLSDIAPDWRHPILGKTVTEMRDALPQSALSGVIPLENHPKRT